MVLYTYLRMHMKPHIYGPGYRGMLRQILNEDGLLSISMAVISIVVCLPIILCRLEYLRRKGCDLRRFNNIYSIYRPWDWRLELFAFSPANAAKLEALRAANPRES